MKEDWQKVSTATVLLSESMVLPLRPEERRSQPGKKVEQTVFQTIRKKKIGLTR